MRTILCVLLLATTAVAKDIDGPLDQYGNSFKLSSWGEDRLVVVAFLGVDCPLASLYVNRLTELRARYANRGVCFIVVNSNEQDSYAEMCEFAKDLPFPMLKDTNNIVADEFGAT